MQELIDALQKMRKHFNSGMQRKYEYRSEQLIKLKQTVLKYKEEIAAALYSDMKKSAEEAYATETGLLLAKINTSGMGAYHGRFTFDTYLNY